MATHFIFLAWRIPWTEEPGELQFMGLQRVGRDWVTNTFTDKPVNKRFWLIECQITTIYLDTITYWPHNILEEMIKLKLLEITLLLEKAMAPYSGTLAWKIPWMEEPGRLQSMGSHRVGHNWSDLAAPCFCPWFNFLLISTSFLSMFWLYDSAPVNIHPLDWITEFKFLAFDPWLCQKPCLCFLLALSGLS